MVYLSCQYLRDLVLKSNEENVYFTFARRDAGMQLYQSPTSPKYKPADARENHRQPSQGHLRPLFFPLDHSRGDSYHQTHPIALQASEADQH